MKGNMIEDTRTDIGKHFKNGNRGYGDEEGWLGFYRVLPFREISSFEFNRGQFGQSVRGYIDPLE